MVDTNPHKTGLRRHLSLRRVVRGFYCVSILMSALLLITVFQLYIGIYEVQGVNRHKHRNWLRSVLADNFASVQHHYTIKAAKNNKEPNAQLLQATSANFSSFRIINKKHRYQLCDNLEILIEARDSLNQIKTRGGDFIFAWLEDEERAASVAADVITDHQNGNYTARFTLPWSGASKVSVLLIHASETISTLKRVRELYPARFTYKGVYRHGTKEVITPCHFSTDMYLLPNETGHTNNFCDYTDSKTKFPWFCLKPKDFSCDDLHLHGADLERANRHFKLLKSENERRIYKRKPGYIKSFTSAQIYVDSSNPEDISRCTSLGSMSCSVTTPPKLPNMAAGFYYRNLWYSATCKNHNKLRKPRIRSCLSNRNMYFLGDSTLRQWMIYLTDNILNNTIKKSTGNKYIGPHFGVDKKHNITLLYRFHGLPVRVPMLVNMTDLQYIPNIIDNMRGGPNVVVVLSLWAHFTSSTIDFYRHRWQAIKLSLLKFVTRYPRTKIFVKSANTREPKFDLSNWYAWELDQVMRQELSSLNFVTIIDTWDMTIGHHTGYNVHPANGVVSQEISMWLSFLC
ncbi:NXPE family member 3-like [Amphiura filiformis]|uniref:NXPE family member 3-like n=1 Tax=Amphiura filiformis TaxID=82378 RepID=UPI003B21A708